MSDARRCPYCHQAVYTSGFGDMAMRGALLLHLFRCSQKPPDMTNEQMAAAADEAVAADAADKSSLP